MSAAQSLSSATAIDCALDDGQTLELDVPMRVNAVHVHVRADGVRRGSRYTVQGSDRATVASKGPLPLAAAELLPDREAKGRPHRSISFFSAVGPEEQTWRRVRFGCGQCHRCGRRACTLPLHASACQPSTAPPRQRLGAAANVTCDLFAHARVVQDGSEQFATWHL
jgi:hypothetical protein